MRNFRGLTKDNTMIYGGCVQIFKKYYIVSDPHECGWTGGKILHHEIWGFREVIPESVAQQVGLKDKNGKEVYDGDRLQSGKRIFTVVWNEEDMQWKAEEEDSRYCLLPLSVWAVSENFEIIPPEVKEKSK